MSVEVTYKGMCEGCNVADLEVDTVTADDFYGVCHLIDTVSCIHEDACEMWYERLKELEKKK